MTDSSKTSYNFRVSTSPRLNPLPFGRIVGLPTDAQKLEYGAHKSSVFPMLEVPDLNIGKQLLLEDGLAVDNENFWGWYRLAVLRLAPPLDMTVMLLNEKGELAVQWDLTGAVAHNIQLNGLHSDGKQVVIMRMDITYTSITLTGIKTD